MAEDLSDPKITSSIREGNTIVFRQVFDSCYESLCDYAFTILRDENDAEDIVQSMFMKLWTKRDELDIKQSIRSYLFRSVYNQCMNHIEHDAVKRKHAEYSKFELNDSVEPDVFPQELDVKIREAVDTLPAQCRTIFIMSRYEELSHNEIGERLKISVNTIQNQICKALKILREQLKDVV